jgi:hypothetical protein
LSLIKGLALLTNSNRAKRRNTKTVVFRAGALDSYSFCTAFGANDKAFFHHLK